jgi:hypothetical protein
MRELKLFTMVKTLETQMQTHDIQELAFEDRLGLLVDAELTARQNKLLHSRLKDARLRLSAMFLSPAPPEQAKHMSPAHSLNKLAEPASPSAINEQQHSFMTSPWQKLMDDITNSWLH